MIPLRVEFCGEVLDVDAARPFIIGRDGPDADLQIDDNPYLHRRFLEISHRDGLWWVENVGNQLAATVGDAAGRLQSWLAPGGRLPLVFATSTVRFSAGSTSYDLDLYVEDATFVGGPGDAPVRSEGDTTLGRVELTRDQRLLIVALAEPALLRPEAGRGDLPSSAAAAERLGWPITKFNRKLDNVCQKLKREGVRGLHGDADKLASGRRSRLVEYALAVRLVTIADLALLSEAHEIALP